MSKICRLCYTEFNSAKIGESLTYYTEVLGARLVETGSDGTRYLSFGLDHHNIALRPAETPSVAVNGFQLRRNVTLDAFEQAMRLHGLKTNRKSDSRPGVAALVEVDTEIGYRFEFFTDMAIPAPGFADHGIAPNKLGHVALTSPAAPTLVRFFAEALGFDQTDWFGGGIATFLTCNHDHHVVNIIEAPQTRLHHIAFELRGSAHQYQASDMLAKAKLPILWGPSRHTAGHNYASYHYDPDRFLIELYADMDVYSADLGMFEPRPWHESLPQRPQDWPLTYLNAWFTEYGCDLSRA